MKELAGTVGAERRYPDAECAVVGRTVTVAARSLLELDHTPLIYIAIECKLMRIETVSLAAAAPRVPSPSAVVA